MAVIEKPVCICDLCGHEWLSEGKGLPGRCASRKCRSTAWNKGGALKELRDSGVVRPASELPQPEVAPTFPPIPEIEDLEDRLSEVVPVAELADNAEPYRISERKAVKSKGKPVSDILLNHLCRHGIYGPLCAQCKEMRANA